MTEQQNPQGPYRTEAKPDTSPKVWRHYFLYVLCGLWNLTVCWPGVLLIRLFWGEHLRWERNPDPKKGDGPSLWCNLKPDSWPTRSWYRYKTRNPETGKREPRRLPEHLREKYGEWRTWGGTTFGHGGFYGPGSGDPSGWSSVQEHEHVHVEQFEAATLRAFWVGLYNGVVFTALGEWEAGIIMLFVNWWFGYIWMAANSIVAWFRGEDPYRGSHHEEAAYRIDEHWQESVKAGEEAKGAHA